MNHLQQFLLFLIDIMKSRRLIIELSKKDFQARYLGSFLGILWAFVQPMTTVLIFWFVFEVGFKSKPIDNFPFILWLITGMFPWFFFAESLGSATTSIIENSYLVKKVVFRVSILPIIKILSALTIHVFFIGILFVMYLYYGFWPDIYNIQVIYYLFAMICLVLGSSWLTAALAVFLRDIGQIVAMLLQFGFWMTPIFWSIAIVPEEYHNLLLLNPCYYIIAGYRNSFIYHKWFWEDAGLAAYFWSVTIIIFVTGAIIFRKLRPHFADVL